MKNLRINPMVVSDLKEIRDYIAEDNPSAASKIVKEIYIRFENIQMFPEIGADLSKRVKFKSGYRYAIWKDYVIIYKITGNYIEVYRVLNRYRDITLIFE